MLSGEEKDKKEYTKKRNTFSFSENTNYGPTKINIPIPGEHQSFRCKTSAKLNEGTEDELVITGYRFNLYKSFLMGFLFIITSGLLWLFLYWMPKVRLRFTHDIVDLDVADTVLVEVNMILFGNRYIAILSFIGHPINNY